MLENAAALATRRDAWGWSYFLLRIFLAGVGVSSSVKSGPESLSISDSVSTSGFLRGDLPQQFLLTVSSSPSTYSMVAALTLVAVAKALRDSVSLAAALALLGEPLLAFRIWARDSSTARVVQVGVGHGEQEWRVGGGEAAHGWCHV